MNSNVYRKKSIGLYVLLTMLILCVLSGVYSCPAFANSQTLISQNQYSDYSESAFEPFLCMQKRSDPILSLFGSSAGVDAPQNCDNPSLVCSDHIGGVGLCDAGGEDKECVIYLKKFLCDALGISDIKFSLEQWQQYLAEKKAEMKQRQALSFDEVLAVCVLTHELKHAVDFAYMGELRSCTMEDWALKRQVSCFEDLLEYTNPADQEKVRKELALRQAMLEFNQCLCESEPPTLKIGQSCAKVCDKFFSQDLEYHAYCRRGAVTYYRQEEIFWFRDK